MALHDTMPARVCPTKITFFNLNLHYPTPTPLCVLIRYARWSLGFVDPPLEVSGRENRCTIKALNERGTVILPAVIQAMESLKADGILKSVDIQTCSGDNTDECGPEGTAIRVDVVVVPPADVGSFSEEDRSRQVSSYIYTKSRRWPSRIDV